jgi:hypothetical protein
MNDLLNLAMKAHGGLERWKQVRNMQAKVTLNGTLWRIKGRPDGLSGVVMRLNTKQPDLTITPFLLAQPGVEVEEIETHNEDGETWRQLSVIFPPEIPTHSARQTYYFNDKGLLQRLDYATDVAGGVAAHYCFDHVTFDGIVVPTFRRVVKRKPEGPIIHGPTAVLIVISDVSLS